MPLLVADLVGPDRGGGMPEPAPFTLNKMESDELVHYIDLDQLEQNLNGLGQLAVERHIFVLAGKRARGVLEKVRVFPSLKQTRFAQLEEAKKSFSSDIVYPEDSPAVYVGDVVVDVQALYPSQEPVKGYQFASTVSSNVPSVEEMANILIDYPADEGSKPRFYRALGPLPALLAVGTVAAEHELYKIPTFEEEERTAIVDAKRFIVEGCKHILGGLDHVLLVICLIIGAVNLRKLVYRITAFTVGHTITLIVGVFGFVPSGQWFIPTVEFLIALTIVFAAVVAVLRKAERSVYWVTCAIGLIHGLGFSFVLREILKVDSPNVWLSLITFNIGVEVGQLGIVLLLWPVLELMRYKTPFGLSVTRHLIAIACTFIAAYWAYERILSLVKVVVS